MAKDLRLYLERGRRPRAARPRSARSPTAVWERFAAAEPGVDFTRIYPFVEGA